MKANRELVAQYVDKLKADPNDSVTFNALVAETQDELVSKAKYMIGSRENEDIAYDLVNDAWLKIIEKNLIPTINTSFMNYMEQMFRNNLNDIYGSDNNKLKRVYSQFNAIPEAEDKDGEVSEIEFTEEDALMHDVPDREREILRAERDEIVHEILDQLEGDEADLLKLYYIDKYTQTQIADILGISQPTVGYRLNKAEEKAKALAVKAEKDHDIDLHKISSVAPLPLFISMYSGWLEDMARFPKNVVPELYKQFFSSSVAGAAAGTMAVAGNTAAKSGTYTRIPKYDGSPAPSASTNTAAQPGTYTRIPKYDGSPAPSASTGTAAQTTAPAYSGQAAPATAQAPAATATSATAQTSAASASSAPVYTETAAAQTAGTAATAAAATSGTGKIIAITAAATLIIGGGGGYIAGNALGVFDTISSSDSNISEISQDNKDGSIEGQNSTAVNTDGQLVWVLEDGLEIDSIDEMERLFTYDYRHFGIQYENLGYPSNFSYSASEPGPYTGNAISARQGSYYGILDYSGNSLYPFTLEAQAEISYYGGRGKDHFTDLNSPIYAYTMGPMFTVSAEGGSRAFSYDFTSLSEPGGLGGNAGPAIYIYIQNNDFHIDCSDPSFISNINTSSINGAVAVVDSPPDLSNYYNTYPVDWEKEHTIGFAIVKDGNTLYQFDGKLVIYTNGFIMYEQNGKYGFVNGSTGQKITEAVYDDAKYFVEDYAPVKKDGKWAYIDSTGKQVTDFVFEDASTPYERRVFVKVNGTYKILDLDATIKNGTYITKELLQS